MPAIDNRDSDSLTFTSCGLMAASNGPASSWTQSYITPRVGWTGFSEVELVQLEDLLTVKGIRLVPTRSNVGSNDNSKCRNRPERVALRLIEAPFEMPMLSRLLRTGHLDDVQLVLAHLAWNAGVEGVGDSPWNHTSRIWYRYICTAEAFSPWSSSPI